MTLVGRRLFKAMLVGGALCSWLRLSYMGGNRLDIEASKKIQSLKTDGAQRVTLQNDHHHRSRRLLAPSSSTSIADRASPHRFDGMVLSRISERSATIHREIATLPHLIQRYPRATEPVTREELLRFGFGDPDDVSLVVCKAAAQVADKRA